MRLDHETWSLGLSRLVRALERRPIFDWVKDLGASAAVRGALITVLKLPDPRWLSLSLALSAAYLLLWAHGLLQGWLRDERRTLLALAAALVVTAFAAVSGYRFPPWPSERCDPAITVDTAGSSTIRGTPDPDRINALGGDDTVEALAGADTVCGNTGDDKLFGGDGDDRLFGGDGDDKVHGRVGNDTLHGNTGEDWVYGRVGNDTLRGGEGPDHLNGGPGDDQCLNTSHIDIVEECEKVIPYR